MEGCMLLAIYVDELVLVHVRRSDCALVHAGGGGGDGGGDGMGDGGDWGNNSNQGPQNNDPTINRHDLDTVSIECPVAHLAGSQVDLQRSEMTTAKLQRNASPHACIHTSRHLLGCFWLWEAM